MTKTSYVLSIILIAFIAVAGCGGPSGGTSYRLGPFSVRVGGTGLTVTDRYGRTILPGSADGTVVFGSAVPAVKGMLGLFTVTETASWMQPGTLSVTASTPEQLNIRITTAAGSGYIVISPLDNHLLGISITAPSGTMAAGQAINRIKLNLSCGPGDHFYGLGEQYSGLDQKGNVVGIWAQDHGFLQDAPNKAMEQAAFHATYFPEPFMLTSKPAGILISSTAYSRFDLCASDPGQASIELWDSGMRVILISDADPLHIVQDFTGIVGRQPLSPPWVIGPWVSVEGGSVSVTTAAAQLRANGIPASAIWYQDWGGAQFMPPDGLQTGHNWRPDFDRYPDMAGMNATLDAMGFKALAYFNSFVNTARDYYPVAAASGFLITQSAGAPYTFTGSLFSPESMLDVSNGDAAAWMQGFMFTAVSLGFSGWMADFGEWLPYDAYMEAGPAAILHNEYPVLWAKMNYQLMSSAIPSGDFAFFMRSGYIGSQPYQPVVWAGDQNTDFDTDFGLPTIVSAAVNLGISGVPIVTHDIAGYASVSNPPSTKELYFRWTELGCFTPVMRTHNGYAYYANWNWNTDADTIRMFDTYATLHVALFPYIYTYMTGAHDLGTPIMQALWLRFYNDPKTAAIDDEYLFGDELLVAPAITQGAATRTLYLPEGDWYPFDGGSAAAGGVSVTVPAPVYAIPVFVPAGSVIPMLTQAPATLITGTSVTVSTLADVITAQTIRVYPGANGGFTVYDGSTFTLTSTAGGLNPTTGTIMTDQDGRTLRQCDSMDTGAVACGMITGASFEAHGTNRGTDVFTLYGRPSNPATSYRIEVF